MLIIFANYILNVLASKGMHHFLPQLILILHCNLSQ